MICHRFVFISLIAKVNLYFNDFFLVLFKMTFFFSPFFFPSLLPHSYIHLWSKVSEVMNVRSGTNLAWCSLYYLIWVKVSIQKKKEKTTKTKKIHFSLKCSNPFKPTVLLLYVVILCCLREKKKAKKAGLCWGGVNGKTVNSDR